MHNVTNYKSISSKCLLVVTSKQYISLGLQDTIEYCKDVYMNYLSDIERSLVKVPDKSNSRPMHGPAVRFLTELLKQGIVSFIFAPFFLKYCENPLTGSRNSVTGCKILT